MSELSHIHLQWLPFQLNLKLGDTLGNNSNLIDGWNITHGTSVVGSNIKGVDRMAVPWIKECSLSKLSRLGWH